MTTRHRLVWAGLALVLGATIALVADKEWARHAGTRVVLQLAPRDPLSLMQGHYMTLAYAVEREVGRDEALQSAVGRGLVVLSLDAQERGTYVRLDDDAQPLRAHEVRVQYVADGYRRVRLAGAEAFYFQEGQEERYQRARYAEVRLTRKGEVLLIRLLDEALNPVDAITEPHTSE